jgi:hypothetical protein
MPAQPTPTLQIARQHHDARAGPQISDDSPIPHITVRPQRKLDTRAAATYSGLARSTLEKLRVFGGGPSYIKIGRRVLYDVTDVERWLVDHRRRSTSDTSTYPIQPPSGSP